MIANDQGHTVIRLPPYHCTYNPIELIWAQIKNYVAKRNCHFRMDSVMMLLHEAINEVTPDNWRKAVEHTDKLRMNDSKEDEGINHFVESFEIHLSSEESSESE